MKYLRYDSWVKYLQLSQKLSMTTHHYCHNHQLDKVLFPLAAKVSIHCSRQEHT